MGQEQPIESEITSCYMALQEMVHPSDYDKFHALMARVLDAASRLGEQSAYDADTVIPPAME